MKKIGREVLFLGISENNPRNGESTFARLGGGRILLAYTEYYSSCGEDHGMARIRGTFSSDEGETWSEPRILIEKDAAAQNIMSPALVTMKDGRVGIFYLRKEIMPDGGLTCMPCFRVSDDGGETWGEQCRCSIPDGYYCGINDGAVATKSGRLLWPMSYHGERYDFDGKCTFRINHTNEMIVLFSDDCGTTWGILPGRVKSPFASTAGNFAEPGVYEQEDGTLWMWMRTGMGHQYDTLSQDGGETWLSPEPNLRFPSPDSPMRVKKIGDLTAALFNPVPYNPLREDTELWRSPKRTPIACAFSKDDGRSLNRRGVSFVNGGLLEYGRNVYLLEDDPSESYCYPALIETEDGFLAAYYHSAGTRACLSATKVVKVRRDEIN